MHQFSEGIVQVWNRLSWSQLGLKFLVLVWSSVVFNCSRLHTDTRQLSNDLNWHTNARLTVKENKKLSYRSENRASAWCIHVIIMLLSSFAIRYVCNFLDKKYTTTNAWESTRIALTVVWPVLSKQLTITTTLAYFKGQEDEATDGIESWSLSTTPLVVNWRLFTREPL